MIYMHADTLHLVSSILSIVCSIAILQKDKNSNVMMPIYFMTAALLVSPTNVNVGDKLLPQSAYWRTRLQKTIQIIVWLWVVVLQRSLTAVSLRIGLVSNILSFIEKFLAILLLVVSVVTIIVVLLLPIPTLRKPTGEHLRIGTLSFNMTVSKSHPRYSVASANSCRDSDGNVLIPAQCWFPMKISRPSVHDSIVKRLAMLWTSGNISSQVMEAELLLGVLASGSGLPTWVMHHVLLATSWSEPQVNLSNTLSSSRLPVVVYSHGMHGWRQVHTSLCEEIASHGYIVFSLDHSPCSSMARPHQLLMASASFDFALPKDIPDSLLPEGKAFYERGIDRRVNDIQILLDWLEGGDSSVCLLPFREAIDITQLHVCGHSYGGATVATLAVRDKRVCSVVSLDGWFYPIATADLQRTSDAHMLMLSSHNWTPSKVRSFPHYTARANSSNTLTLCV
jgi:dienelactone hydrolase